MTQERIKGLGGQSPNSVSFPYLALESKETMLKVYCERGAYRQDLSVLERSGQIEIVHYPYEGQNKKIRTRATPSVVTMDSTYVTFDDTTPIGEMSASDKFPEILSIIGAANEFDARHLDSAYKSGCDCFLTPDKKDISSKSENLEKLLTLRVFHATHNWQEFVAYVQERARPALKAEGPASGGSMA